MPDVTLYNGWLLNLAARFQAEFDNIATVHNFEYGDEFEIAVCKVLKTILPRRASVCRGYIVAQNGALAGDDIIIFDSSRFPALRAIGEDLSQKQQVPAESVLAYIEAKHTLFLHGDSGQSIDKATLQTCNVKDLSRTPLEHRHLIPGLDLGAQVIPPPTYPNIRNPWYTAIWSRKSDWPSDQHVLCPSRFAPNIPSHLRPDLVATDKGCLIPMLVKRDTGLPLPRFEIRPFLCQETEHVWSNIETTTLGIAAVHLLSAIEWIVLSEIPWNPMMSSCIRESHLTWSNVANVAEQTHALEPAAGPVSTGESSPPAQ
jgi:hypothetical protein